MIEDLVKQYNETAALSRAQYITGWKLLPRDFCIGKVCLVCVCGRLTTHRNLHPRSSSRGVWYIRRMPQSLMLFMQKLQANVRDFVWKPYRVHGTWWILCWYCHVKKVLIFIVCVCFRIFLLFHILLTILNAKLG